MPDQPSNDEAVENQAIEDQNIDGDEAGSRQAQAASEPEKSGLVSAVTWRRVVMALVLVVAGFWFVKSVWPHNLRDGFIAFDPDVSLFPPAPVEDASTLAGIGRPDSLPVGADGCPYGIGWGPDSWFGRDWHTVRHDWEDDGEAKAWVISEHTVGFDDLDEYEYYLDGFYLRTKYCGWLYDRLDGAGFNSILVELDGLPNEGFAFTSDASPKNASLGSSFGDSNPDDFDALTAVIPGPKRGQLMFYTWVGWGAEVPATDFVASLNEMYNAARAAPDPDPDFDDTDTNGARADFVPFLASEAGMESVLGENTDDGQGPRLWSELCSRSSKTLDLDIDEWPVQEYDYVGNDDRSVGFSTARFNDQARYLEAKRSAVATYAPICIDGFQNGGLLIEPITLADVPEGTAAAVWHEDDAENYVAVVTDDDRQLIMVMAWDERDSEVPVDDFAAALTQAWAQFTADNS